MRRKPQFLPYNFLDIIGKVTIMELVVLTLRALPGKNDAHNNN